MLKNGRMGGKGIRGRVIEGIEQTNVKHIYRGYTMRHSFECQLKY
jgi:hypothetical protein